VFTTLLSNLQSLISTRFLVASLFPTLAFWFGHASMLFWFDPPFAEFVQSNVQQGAGLALIVGAAALIAVAFTAYVESALLPGMQSLMEGTWRDWIVALFAPAQMKRYARIDEELAKNNILRGALGTTPTGQTQAEAWHDALRRARENGNGVTANAFTKKEATAKQIKRLARRRDRSRAVSPADLQVAFTRLVLDLNSNNADMPGPHGDFALEKTRQQLWDLIDYADAYAASQFRALTAVRQAEFGKPPLAPTRMGNVAKSVQAYGVERYNFNFELFWSRLQLAVQRDKDFEPVLRATKTQLDFLISCAALVLLWALPWAVFLFATQGPPLLFLGIAIGGPLAGYVLYRAAVAQYRTLADLLRSAVDLFRLDLLTALQYQRPASVDQERDLWYTLDALHALYEVRELPYAASSTKAKSP
jgi:hypothetical protein